MLQGEHSAILLTCIKRYLVLKTNFWYLLEWPFYTSFTVYPLRQTGTTFNKNAYNADAITSLYKKLLRCAMSFFCRFVFQENSLMEIAIKISKGVDLCTFNDSFTPLTTVKQEGIDYLDIRVGSACQYLFMRICRLLPPPPPP